MQAIALMPLLSKLSENGAQKVKAKGKRQKAKFIEKCL